MKYTLAIAKMRNRLASLGVPPDTVIVGSAAWHSLVQECTTFRTMELSGLRRIEDLQSEIAMPVTNLYIMDLVVHESLTCPPEAMYIGVGLKP